jgi:uncharacterized oligopeptide transporter (OPT) family protein
MTADARSGADQQIPPHPRAFEPGTLVLTVVLAAVGAFIGIHLITQLGISTHTSVIGALIAMMVGRIGLSGFQKFRSVHRQNLAQTAISAGTFGAANAIITPLAITWAFGRPDLIWPMFIGAAGGLVVDAWILYRAFGSKFLSARNAWPPGVAAAEAIKAGDQGGRRAKVLVAGGVIGFVLAWFGLSASAAGVALIGNVVALLMFGLGLLIVQYYSLLPGLADFSLAENYIPHGIMIGAGVIALVQAGFILFRRQRAKRDAQPVQEAAPDPDPDPAMADTVSPRRLRGGLGSGFLLFIAVAVLLAFVSGIYAEMSIPVLIGWVLYAAVAAFVSELIVGLAAMHAGWFPATAITLIFLVLGLAIGFPPEPLLVLVGYTASTGPAFSDMGYDLKTGWILRKVHSRHPGYADYERSGRKQQYYSAMIGFVVAMGMAALLWKPYFEADRIPPVAVVFADTIKVGLTNTEALQTMLLWALLGAALQAAGGATRQMGIMLATGLLIAAPYAGWLVLGALAVKLVVVRLKGRQAEEDLQLIGAGIITGDAFASLGRIFR